jgi:chromosomal replication initiator protein
MRLDPMQNLRSFIVGSSNREAVRVVRRAVGRARDRPNPVLIVGETGLGKSHLLHAAAGEVWRASEGAEIRAFKAEDLWNRYVTAIRAGRMQEFRAYTRTGDALIVDELEDLVDRPTTFEEVARTILAYVESDRPVLLAMEPARYNFIEWFVRSAPTGAAVRLRKPTLKQRVSAIRRAAGRTRLSIRRLSDLARGATTIPLARAAATNALFRLRL